jgi:hypothetical protein
MKEEVLLLALPLPGEREESGDGRFCQQKVTVLCSLSPPTQFALGAEECPGLRPVLRDAVTHAEGERVGNPVA